jgi:DNA repair protein RecO (recombination protein O)
MEHKYTAIVLQKRDINETDRIYTFYTLEQGKVVSIARGVRKPQAKLAGGLENFNLVDLHIVRSRGLGNIKGVIVENNFSQLRQNLDVLQTIFQVVKIFNSLIGEDEPDKEIFNLLLQYLQTGNENPDKILLLSLGFQFKLLDLLGYRMEVACCVYCRDKIFAGQNYFSAKHGGILCEKCSAKTQNKIIISTNAIKIIRIFLQNNLKSLIKLQVKTKDSNEVRAVLRDFLRWKQ